MPNWVYNHLTLRHRNSQKFQSLIDWFKQNYTEGVEVDNWGDICVQVNEDLGLFGHIFPEPEYANEHDWYNWRVHNWGCKWDAKDIRVVSLVDEFEITFLTPWATPDGIIRVLRDDDWDIRLLVVEETLAWGYEYEIEYQSDDDDDKHSTNETYNDVYGNRHNLPDYFRDFVNEYYDLDTRTSVDTDELLSSSLSSIASNIRTIGRDDDTDEEQ